MSLIEFLNTCWCHFRIRFHSFILNYCINPLVDFLACMYRNEQSDLLSVWTDSTLKKGIGLWCTPGKSLDKRIVISLLLPLLFAVTNVIHLYN